MACFLVVRSMDQLLSSDVIDTQDNDSRAGQRQEVTHNRADETGVRRGMANPEREAERAGEERAQMGDMNKQTQ